MSESFQKKSDEIREIFARSSLPESKYEILIEMGRALPIMSEAKKTLENLVAGCQSQLYLTSHLQNGRIYFEASSNALISAGLAALLIAVYSGELPEIILKHPPHFLLELGIHTSLSIHRSNGLAHIHLRMKQEAWHQLRDVVYCEP